MKRGLIIIVTIAVSIVASISSNAQQGLYPNTFNSIDVTLLEGPFKHARDLNIKTLLQYDVDRLLAPYLKEAGLPPKATDYANWDGLAGHVGGHYLSALALHYAATSNAECKTRMEYMINELMTCQNANTKNHSDWGTGYVGGVPNSNQLWPALQSSDFTLFHKAWVPWYNVHKMYAGLRDAWLYGGNQQAKTMFLKFCDWGIAITSKLSDTQMQTMLDTEHGGMNEVFADAFQITKNEKYLVAARRFSHKALLDPMSRKKDNLDNKHANTQVPKAVGFQRIGELDGDSTYINAGAFFWETVTTKRSLAFGGNSRREFFPSALACSDFVNDVEGPESCNSYNMLKLAENLFRMKPHARYIDYYERTLFNHILSTQHPVHGGYVYFTPTRPRHYKVYSAANEAMWCCVGSGMENHGKYNQAIYTHQNDSLFLNLFVASTLHWRDKKIMLKQETVFPYDDQTKLTITQGSDLFTLLVRHPSWVTNGELKITINGKNVQYMVLPSSYIAIRRQWKKGDVLDLILPMKTTIEHLPNIPTYTAFMHGPILLSTKTGTEDLKGLVADGSRWGHIANGERLPIDKAPIIIDDNPSTMGSRLVPVKGKPLTFELSNLHVINPVSTVFQPFYQIHDTRYMIYWLTLTNTQYKSYLDSIAASENDKLALLKKTIDFVAPGEQQPEADHEMQSSNSRTGNQLGEFWRDAPSGGYFSYKLSTNGETTADLMVRYWGSEWGNRAFDIYVDDKKLVTENNTGKWNQSKFQDVVYSIPTAMLENKKHIRIKFQPLEKNTAGAVYYVRLLKAK